MNSPQSRFLLELDKLRRDVNRQILTPRIDKLNIDQIRPVVTAIAMARADYIETLLNLGEKGQHPPSEAEIAELKNKRECYDELVAASQALETIIQRDYIDVVPEKRGH